MDDEPSIVERTGLVVLSEGEIVFPAPVGEAILTRIDEDGLILEFRVEVEVRIVAACDPEQHADATLGRLTAALESLT
jgi:hypothetical protein